jgi:flavin-dependent dehydrogenase
MKRPASNHRIELHEGALVAVVGGGPGGSFFAIHLLRHARRLGRHVRVVIFERRRSSPDGDPTHAHDAWKGCNYCAGGISPKLSDVLRELGLELPADMIQSRMASITIQGFWKNIEMEVPDGRDLFSVYRGSRPGKRPDQAANFDSFLLDQALRAGALLHCAEVTDVERVGDGRPLLHFELGGKSRSLEADLVVFASGVNEVAGSAPRRSRVLQAIARMIPDFTPPRVRHALILELQPKPHLPAHLEATVHFIEYGSPKLPIEMCSIIPKRDFLTVTLVGKAVDAAEAKGEVNRIVNQFLDLPQIRKLLSPGTYLQLGCACRPNIVVGSARAPFADRAAAVGDLVTARLYKDGILSAHQTAAALADTVLREGINSASLSKGYGPTLRHFRRDNAFARVVFLLHRVFFSSSVLSRVLYQAAITERKTTPRPRRRLENILWSVASGDADYTRILLSMLHPRTVSSVLLGGGVITLRNYLTELLFGLRWEGIGRFTTGVAIERLEQKRRDFSALIADAHVAVPGRLEFERMYTIKIAGSGPEILKETGRFGEADRGYLRPRWLEVRRTAGEPNQPGCVVTYIVAGGLLSFSLKLETLMGDHMAVYRVQNGFARGGILIFETEKHTGQLCPLSIYVAFNFQRGSNVATNIFWWCFRRLFPAFMHDVLWNHSLCQFKDTLESK